MNNRKQYAVYSLIVLAVFVMTTALIPAYRQDFSRFYGPFHPMLIISLCSFMGAGCLRVLQISAGFHIMKGKDTWDGILRAACLATLMAPFAVLADVFIGYPESINIPMPRALLFYPAIGFVAEIFFHILPLAIVLILLTPFRKHIGSRVVIRIGLSLAILAEPVFQVLHSGEGFSLLAVFTGIHVLGISFFQLRIFRRCDFVSMLAFRLIYYMYWHIIWGVVRLEVLF